MPLTIGIDVDETIRQSMQATVNIYNELHEADLKYGDICTWSLNSYMVKESNPSTLFTRFPKEIFEESPIVDHAREAITYLKGIGHSIWIVTHQFRGVEKYTLEWLLKYDIPYDGIVFTKDKAVVGCDVLIDDGVHNLEPFRDSGRRAICFSRPWNTEQYWKGERINHWRDVYHLFPTY